jgi:hypothetical protein
MTLDPTTIRDLPNASALTGAERVPMDQGDTTVNATTEAIAGTLPDATTTRAGKMTATDKTRLDQLGADDSPSFAGLTITGTDPVVIPHLHADVAGTLYFHVKNTSGGTLTKGTPVSVVGTVGDTTTLEVVATNPGVAGRTHAHGLLYSELANNGLGHAVVLGELQGMNTAALAPSSELWVATAGGTTGTRPATAAQQVATVGRQHATTGTLLVSIEGVEPTPAQIGAAPAAQGVTNGNSHNHDGGDGAQIAYSSLLGTPTLGGAAALNVGTSAGTVAAGDDSRLSDTREWTATTVSQAEAEAGTETTRRAWTAQRVRQAIAAWWVSVSAAPGAIGGTTPDTGQFTGVGLGGVAPRTGYAAVLGSNVLPRAQIVTISGSTYTCDIRAANRFMLAAAIAGNTTIAFSNVADLAVTSTFAEYVEVEVDFRYTSGVITISAAGFTTTWDGNTAATPTAGEIETLIVRITPAIASTPFSTATVYVAPMRGNT